MESPDKLLLDTELRRIAAAVLPALQPDVIAAKTDLFNGSGGVILFYLRLYEHYKEQHYLDVSITAADTLLYHPEIMQQQYYTFCTGATGLLYLCVKLYEATGRRRYLDRAIALTAHFKEGIQQRVQQDDWLSGHAGNIFVLTYLYAHTQEGSLLPLLRSLTDTLIQQARVAPEGLRWGHVKMSFDSLTGFSHGASGMAYAWMQVAAYFRDEGLQYLAGQALDYEMQYYDPTARNWLDLRLTNTCIGRENFFHWDIHRFREDAAATNTWAHGAAGAGIARLLAYKMLPRAEWRVQLQDAVERSLEDAQQLKRGDFTLCSGYGGIVFFLLQAAEALQQPDLQQAAQILALQAVRYYHTYGTYNSYVPTMMQDAGLFSGLSGVGYMLASLLMPFRDDSVLHPVIPAGRQVPPLYAAGEVKRRLFLKYYPHTMRLLMATGWTLPDVPGIGMLETMLQKAVAALPEEHRRQAADAFAFEQQRTALWKEHRGLLYYTRRNEFTGGMPEATAEALLRMKWVVMEQVRLCRTHWQWDQQELASAAGEYCYLMQNHAYGVAVFPVGKLTAAIFDHFQGGYTLEETLVRCFNVADRQQAVTMLVAQTLSLLRQGFIKPVL